MPAASHHGTASLLLAFLGDAGQLAWSRLHECHAQAVSRVVHELVVGERDAEFGLAGHQVGSALRARAFAEALLGRLAELCCCCLVQPIP